VGKPHILQAHGVQLLGPPVSNVKCKGHFASWCFSKAMLLPANEVLVDAEVDKSSGKEDKLTLNDTFLDAVTSEGPLGNQLLTNHWQKRS